MSRHRRPGPHATDLTAEDIAAYPSLLRELRSRLNVIVMASIAIAQRDPDRYRSQAGEIAAARKLLAKVLNALRGWDMGQ